jgi:hypothetical protein
VKNFNLGPSQSESAVQPIPVPQSACPYLRLVSVATAQAQTPWLNGSVSDWPRFSRDLSTPLASLDGALGAAIPHVPDAVARDFRDTRREVEVGRMALLAAHSLAEYLGRANVTGGYAALRHASELVGTTCGFQVAPSLF